MPFIVRIKVLLVALFYILLVFCLIFFSVYFSLFFLIPALLFILTGIFLIFIYYPKFDPTGYTIYKVKKGNKRVIFTFDDGPDPVVTPEILNILKEHSIKAIFFCLGSKAERYPEIIKRIREEGHILANHGFSHIKLHNRDREFINFEIDKAEKVLEPLTVINGKKLFRPPHGFKNFTLIKLLKEKNYILIGWTRGIWDSDGSDAGILLRRALAYLDDGVIFLFHDGRDIEGSGRNTVEFLRQFIPIVKERNFVITDSLIN